VDLRSGGFVATPNLESSMRVTVVLVVQLSSISVEAQQTLLVPSQCSQFFRGHKWPDRNIEF
jgi:hypothetical protein